MVKDLVGPSTGVHCLLVLTVSQVVLPLSQVREAGVYVNGCFLNCNDENDIERLTTQLKSLMQSEMLESKIPSHQMDSFVTMILRACCRTRTGFVSFEMIDSLFGSPGRLLVCMSPAIGGVAGQALLGLLTHALDPRLGETGERLDSGSAN